MIDWSGFTFPMNFDDVINGATKIWNSIGPVVYIFVGLSIAFFALEGLFAVFVKNESFLPWRR